MRMVEVDDISFMYSSAAKVIDGVSFTVDKGEFVSILGPSGCGKSTLLRIIAGLIKPSKGRVLYMGNDVKGPTKGLSFVFQDFALLPWLTNLQNVELGFSLMDITEEEKRKRSLLLLDKFGLIGFEDAYPNVLSGGMKQRVGIARAIASDPDVLLMDEPFSSLDELTAGTLRNDILFMLKNEDLPVHSVIMVTHNVEEAIELSDKVVILSEKPAYVKAVKDLRMKQPRNKHGREFLKNMDSVYAVLAKD
jgi:NitT/TauT family transport system ATP-binding protein